MRANLFSLPFEPVLQAGVAKVLSATGCEVGVTENLGADGRTYELLWDVFDKIIVISSILGLLFSFLWYQLPLGHIPRTMQGRISIY